jgi:orotidine-5'-phosphate decarboxylase
MVIDNPIIIALDTRSAEEAVRLATAVSDLVGGFKVGLGLLHGPGPGVIDALARLDKPVFADAKLHDIPSQVEAAARRLGGHGARWVSAHVSGGRAMLEAAVSGLADGSGEAAAGILGVTVLTSLDAGDLAEIGVDRSPGELVSRMAKVAAAAGCEGVVCSPMELVVVGQAAPELLRCAPGIRPIEADDDQTRTATPAAAISRGADLIVIGRPITAAPDPVAAAEAIRSEVLGAVTGG